MRAQTNEKVEFILAQAAELFLSKGYEATSMRDIAERCGISKSLLYHHFTDKYQIFSRIAAHSGIGLNEAVAARVAEHEDAPERLRAFMVATASFFEENRLSWIAASQDFWSSNEGRMSLQVKLRRDSFEKLLRNILEEGVASGAFEIADIRLAGRLILSSLNWMHRWYNPAGKRRAAEIADEYYALILNGIGGKRSASGA